MRANFPLLAMALQIKRIKPLLPFLMKKMHNDYLI